MALKKTKNRKVKHHKLVKSKKHTKKHFKNHTKKHYKKHNKKYLNKSKRIFKGGFGPGACPQVGPQWNPVKGGNYFSNGTPIGVGGTDPYYGDTSPAPQTTWGTASTLSGQSGGSTINPLIPQPFIDAYRGVLYNVQNMYNTMQGLRPPQGVLPWDQAFQQP